MNSTTEKVTYETPVVADHGSIADNTFDGRRRRRRRPSRPKPPNGPGLSSTF